MTKLEVYKEIFYCLTATLALFCALEIIFPSMILAYLNLNLVLISWIIVGIMILVSNDKKYE